MNTAPLTPHYLSRIERIADGWVHAIGLTAGAIGAIALVAISIAMGGFGQAGAVGLYATCLLLMLALSAAYNLADQSPARGLLRRFDHAAIFIMIAGSYTPFTTQRFDGAWAIGMTLAVWTIALAGAAGKLFLPGISKRVWIAGYLLLGWMVLIGLDPLVHGVSRVALVLLVIGGAIYTIGAGLYSIDRLPFRRAVWHACVLAAAGVHYAAILTGVVLASA